MKTIGLMIVRNESWILKTTIPALLPLVDELLVIDGNSTDDTVKILKSFGRKVRVRPQRASENYSSWRQSLLDWGRERNGTHFVCLDADELFTADYAPVLHEDLVRLKPGQKLMLDWISIWGSPKKFRDDGSIWATNTKDFAFCDDGVMRHAEQWIHEGRTPGDNTPERMVAVVRDRGAVLHLQFVSLTRFRFKQAFTMCREFFQKGGNPKDINHRYAFTKDAADVPCSDVPLKWLRGIKIPAGLSKAGPDWYLPAITAYFDEKGIEAFEPLDIWHLPQLRAEFVRRCGREPVPRHYGPVRRSLRSFITWCAKVSPRWLVRIGERFVGWR